MSGPATPPKRPSVYQFTLGACTVTNILDGFIHRADLHPFVATNVEADAVEALVQEYRLPYPKTEHNFVATVLEINGKIIAIDPGFGAAAPTPTTGFFMEGLSTVEYSPDDIDIVLISHCHPDHIGNVATDGVPTFPNAEIVIGRTEFEFWKAGEDVSEMRQPTLQLFQKTLLPLEGQLRLIEPGDDIVPGLAAIDAFGHSAGHLVFHLKSNDIELLMLNDTTAHYVVSLAHPEWHFSMDDNPEQAAISRRRVLEMAAEGRMPVAGFHLPFPALGFVERRGDGFEFRPATYQFNLTTDE